MFGVGKDSFKELWREVLPEVLDQEMTDSIGAEKGERSPGRLGYGKVGENPPGYGTRPNISHAKIRPVSLAFRERFLDFSAEPLPKPRPSPDRGFLAPREAVSPVTRTLL
jgi:hypothetical protein